jgi:hypothetical protein
LLPKRYPIPPPTRRHDAAIGRMFFMQFVCRS